MTNKLILFTPKIENGSSSITLDAIFNSITKIQTLDDSTLIKKLNDTY